MSALNKAITAAGFAIGAVAMSYAAPSIIQGTQNAYAAVADTAQGINTARLQQECNKDWGPSTQTIQGQQVKCNMPVPATF